MVQSNALEAQALPSGWNNYKKISAKPKENMVIKILTSSYMIKKSQFLVHLRKAQKWPMSTLPSMLSINIKRSGV